MRVGLVCRLQTRQRVATPKARNPRIIIVQVAGSGIAIMPGLGKGSGVDDMGGGVGEFGVGTPAGVMPGLSSGAGKNGAKGEPMT
jgi:hypothetical protein